MYTQSCSAVLTRVQGHLSTTESTTWRRDATSPRHEDAAACAPAMRAAGPVTSKNKKSEKNRTLTHENEMVCSCTILVPNYTNLPPPSDISPAHTLLVSASISTFFLRALAPRLLFYGTQESASPTPRLLGRARRRGKRDDGSGGGCLSASLNSELVNRADLIEFQMFPFCLLLLIIIIIPT